MKTLKYLFLAGLCALAVMSCKKDNTNEGGENGGGDNGGGEQIDNKAPVKIDGNFDDWKDVATGLTADGNILAFKVAYDEDYVYFYNERKVNDPALWGGGYYYWSWDADGDAETGIKDNGNYSFNGVEGYVYLTLFTGTSEVPVIAAEPSGSSDPKGINAEATASGKVASDGTTVETEVRILRKDTGIQKGQTVKFYCFGNKSGSNLKDIPVTVKIEK